MTIKNSENLLNKLSISSDAFFKNGHFGIERETLRVLDCSISKLHHSSSLGSALCNKYITTDFSESLIELITPPKTNKDEGFFLLDDLHHYVERNIDKETLWPFSMPPYIDSEEDIRIANYGKSNDGLFKVLYRKGLSNRYGRLMQSIAGLHFNYSFSSHFWTLPIFERYTTSKPQLMEHIYMRAIRNINRLNWLILYFFGASPVISENFFSEEIPGLKRKNDFFYSQYATSFRMSSLGYQPVSQNNLKISFNSIDEYAKDLFMATNTISKDFQGISSLQNDEAKQINANILQIEDEYYSVARPKSNASNYKRMTSNLLKFGIDYIELRSLDLDPFSRTGIKRETIDFLEIFLIFCALSPSSQINSYERNQIKHNEQLVSLDGRKPGINLIRDEKEITIKDWANEILDGMEIVSDLLGKNRNIFNSYRSMARDPDKTLSGELLREMMQKNIGFHEMGGILASKYKQEYLSIKPSENENWRLIEDHCFKSIKKQEEIENNDSGTFEDYVKNYFSDR